MAWYKRTKPTAAPAAMAPRRRSEQMSMVKQLLGLRSKLKPPKLLPEPDRVEACFWSMETKGEWVFWGLNIKMEDEVTGLLEITHKQYYFVFSAWFVQ